MRVIRQLVIPALVLVAGLQGTAAASSEDTTSGPANTLSLGGFYSQGDYGADSDTHVTYVPLSWEHSRSPWRFSVTMPWLRISGPGNVLVNTGGVSRPGQPDLPDPAAPETVRDSGPGDVVLKAAWELPARSTDGPFVDLVAEIKLPTADETRGLGTGATDTGLQVDLYQRMGQSTLFGSLGHRWRGSSEFFAGLQDTWWLSLGFSRPWLQESIPGEWSWGVIYDYRQPASRLSVETSEVLPYLNWSPGGQWTVMAYVLRGFTRDSADQAAGFQVSWSW